MSGVRANAWLLRSSVEESLPAQREENQEANREPSRARSPNPGNESIPRIPFGKEGDASLSYLVAWDNYSTGQ